MRPVDINAVTELATTVLAGLGYELVDLEWKHEAGRWVLRLSIDFLAPGPDGQWPLVSHKDCERVSRQLSAELDAADPIKVPFTLEVSSPGLDRPLKKESDYLRFLGQKARLRSRTALPVPGAAADHPGRKNFLGRLLGVEGGRVRIDVDGTPYEVPLADIEKANVEYEF